MKEINEYCILDNNLITDSTIEYIQEYVEKEDYNNLLDKCIDNHLLLQLQLGSLYIKHSVCFFTSLLQKQIEQIEEMEILNCKTKDGKDITLKVNNVDIGYSFLINAGGPVSLISKIEEKHGMITRHMSCQNDFNKEISGYTLYLEIDISVLNINNN